MLRHCALDQYIYWDAQLQRTIAQPIGCSVIVIEMDSEARHNSPVLNNAATASRAIEVNDNGTGDAPMLPKLLSLILPEEPIRSVRGDGAYDTEACHAAIAERKAQAIIPPRENARGEIDADRSGFTQRSAASVPTTSVVSQK